MSSQTASDTDQQLVLRQPTALDGEPLSRLIQACPPLDRNSVYCNLLQCSHFADTAVVAEKDGELLGSITGYRVPQRPQTWFVWQVAVDDRARGQGLAGRMLQHVLERHADLRYLETTITPDNDSSWALFKSFARRADAEFTHTEHFQRESHFAGQHADEHLVRIGPFNHPSIK